MVFPTGNLKQDVSFGTGRTFCKRPGKWTMHDNNTWEKYVGIKR